MHDGFIDLHLHVLPGIDDGARSVEASLAMLRGLAAEGYSYFVATPHLDERRHRYGRERIVEAHALLSEALAADGLEVRLDFGAEYAYGARFHAHIAEQRAVTIGGSRYVLVELPEDHMPSTMASALFQVGSAGYYPVIAHPERCAPFREHPDALVELASGRALVQVSFRSLAGTFGRAIKKTAWRLVSSGEADLVATDCHSPRELKKIVRPVMKALRKRLDPDHMDQLMRRFPAKMMATTEKGGAVAPG